MEAADDIAYATADLEDALKKGLFTLDQFIYYFEKQIGEINSNGYPKIYTKRLFDDLKDRIEGSDRGTELDLISFQKWMELVRKWLMFVVAYRFSKSYNDILNGTYKYDMFYDTNHQFTIKILKGAMSEFVFDNKEILKLELAAKKIIGSLLKDFIYSVIYFEEESSGDNKYKPSKADKKLISIISTNYKNDYLRAKIKNDDENLYLRFMMVTDYISGMTDSFAKNLYQELNGID
jgi:dGTPase